MDLTTEEGFDSVSASFQPWLRQHDDAEQQAAIRSVLGKKAGAKIGIDCYVSPDARILTQRLVLGDRSWIAGAAIIRGNVEIGRDCSVNPYAHIAGNVKIGNACRIASLASIYGFDHGIARTDVPVMMQGVTSRGVILGDDVWVGANVTIVDGVEIGPHCVIAGGAVVTKSFPAYQVIGGNPAKALRDRRKNELDTEAAKAIVDDAPRRRVRDLLFDVSPYDGFAPDLMPDLQGWDSENPVFRQTIEQVRPALIVEIGTWKGASAVHMAKICRELGLDTEIVCIDTWLGNWQHWARKTGIGSRVDLRLKHGFPQLYEQFLTNVIHEHVTNYITPLPLTGIAGARLFAQYGLKADLIYVDGDHEYESAIADLRGWLPLLAEGGVLLGDDYLFPGVERAANEIAADGKWGLKKLTANKFTITRQ